MDAFQLAFGRAGVEGSRSDLQQPDPNPETASHIGGDLASLLGFVAPVDGSLAADAQARWRTDNAVSLQIARRFMVRGLWKCVFRLQTTLDPERALMKGLLHSTSQEWEHEQLHSHLMGKAKEYRVLNVHQGPLLRNFFVDSMATLCSDLLWDQFEKSELFRTNLFREAMRPAAVGYQLVWLRTCGLPYKLFTLLQGGANLAAVAEDILATPACILDTWSRSFLAHHSSVEALTGPQARAELVVIADSFLGTTYSTERLHSKNLRRSRDKQLRRADVHFLGLSHMGWSAPTICKRDDVSVIPHAKKKEKKVVEPEIADDNANPAEKASRRHGGGGGAWRAFLHRQGLQFKGQGQNLSAAYASLSDQEKAWYKEVGHQGAGFGGLWVNTKIPFLWSTFAHPVSQPNCLVFVSALLYKYCLYVAQNLDTSQPKASDTIKTVCHLQCMPAPVFRVSDVAGMANVKCRQEDVFTILETHVVAFLTEPTNRKLQAAG